MYRDLPAAMAAQRALNGAFIPSLTGWLPRCLPAWQATLSHLPRRQAFKSRRRNTADVHTFGDAVHKEVTAL